MSKGRSDKPRNVLGQDLEANRQTMRDMEADLRQQAPVPLDPLWVRNQLAAIGGVPSPTRRRLRRWIPIAASLACLLPATAWLTTRFLAPAPAPVLWPEARDSARTLDNATAVALLGQVSEPVEKRNAAFVSLAGRARRAIDQLLTIAQDPTDETVANLAHTHLLRIEQTLVERPSLPPYQVDRDIGVPGTEASDQSRSRDARTADIAKLGDFAAHVVQTLQQFDPQGISLLQSSKKVALSKFANRFNLEPTPDGQAPFYVPRKTGGQ